VRERELGNSRWLDYEEQGALTVRELELSL